MSDNLLTGVATASLKVDGTQVPEAGRDIEEIVVDATFNLPAMASIRLLDPQGKWAKDRTFKLGAAIEIMLGPPQSLLKEPLGKVFQGEIVALEPSFSALGTSTFTIRAYDMSHRLHYGTKSRTYTQVTDADIVRKIAQENGIQAGTLESKIKYEYVAQNNLSDYEFLSVRARRVGCILAMIDGKLHFAKPDAIIKPGPTLEMGESLREFSLRLSVAQQAQTIETYGWDVLKKEAIVGSAIPAKTWNQNGEGMTGGVAARSAIRVSATTALTTFVPGTKPEADAMAISAAGDQEGKFLEADAVAYGNPKILPGCQVELKEMALRFDGKYYVTSATHIYNTAGYEVHFTVSGRYPQSFNQLLNGNSRGISEPGSVTSVVIGIVTNNNDPEALGRVKVKFPWMPKLRGVEIESNWARLSALGAGKTRGIYYLPEVNDEVLVAFEHGNINRPFILGGLWNGKDKPPERNDAAARNGVVNLRMIVSRSGHSIVLDDTQGKESILVKDFTGKQSIFIDSKKKSMTVLADGDLTIDVKGNISISAGGNIDITSRKNITVTATQNIQMEAKQSFKVDASVDISMKGTAGAKLVSTTGSADLEGASVKVSATANTAISGKLITLN